NTITSPDRVICDLRQMPPLEERRLLHATQGDANVDPTRGDDHRNTWQGLGAGAGVQGPLRRRAEGARLRAVRNLPGCRRSRPAHAARALDGQGRPRHAREAEQHAAAAPAGAPCRQRRARGLRIQPDAVGTGPRRTAMPDDIVFDGGSEADRREIMGALDAYRPANAAYDWQRLAQIWSHDPTNVFFNLNGQTDVGLAHWTRLRKYYRERRSEERGVGKWCGG